MTLNIAHPIDTYGLENQNPIKVLKSGHVSHVAQNGLIEERYPIIGKIGTSDSLQVETNRIIRLKHLAQMYHSQIDRKDPVWLQEASSGDIYTRQAVVYDITITWFAQRDRNRLVSLSDGRVFYGELVILRDREWESTIEEGKSETDLEMIGDQFELPSYYFKGMTGARISNLILKDMTDSGTDTIHKAWIGIREKGLGFSSFVARQECEGGSNGADASNVSEAYYSGGEAKRVTFATAPWMEDRVRFTLANFTGSNHHHFFGEYLVLLGYYHNGGSTDMVAQLTGDSVVNGPPVILPPASTTSPFIAELGYIRLPGQSLRGRYSDLTISNMGFNIAAERTGGSNNLYLDFIVLMPARRLLKLTATQILTGRLYFHEHPERAMVAYQTYTGATTFRNMIDFEASNFRLPTDEAMIVVAANSGNNYNHLDLKANMILDWRQTFEAYHTS